ncbi:hypothetical protein OSB04_001883 [Centaurea solstitialis]|uniref:F-box domain-containing protein n=1 Tax=Centaurea solstitialis TaxID=347529 RepID=A0AA38U9Y0_9ASTR|nr:hypothetical protein OSB04_001883 [Centaurea solstitialis]
MAAFEPSSTMEETRNWSEMPDEIMRMILERLSAVEVLNSAQKVCRNWRMICKDPEMWKVIDMHHIRYTNYDIEKLTKQALHRSGGELIDITLDSFVTEDLLDYISRRSSKLKSLRLTNCLRITTFGLIRALKRLPHLETLHLSGIFSCSEHIKVVGQICPQLKSFRMKTQFLECNDAYAIAVANSMPALCHLQLHGITMTDNGLQAILHGCLRLESLDLHHCFYRNLDANLVKLCGDRIKDFKRPYFYDKMLDELCGDNVFSANDHFWLD